MGRASKDKRDIYYRKAKEEGFRARSAYKLLQIDEELGIFKGVTRAVDLCAAPGSWSQVLSARLRFASVVAAEERAAGGDGSGGGAKAARIRPKDFPAYAAKLQQQQQQQQQQQNDESDAAAAAPVGPAPARIVAVDLQEMAPIEGVHLIQGDITTVKTATEVIEALGGEKADIVVCDGAPDVTGLHELDEYVQHQLLLSALNITTFMLRAGGDFVAKIFRGPNTPFLCAKSEVFFEHVTVVKPKSSRNASMEGFIVCRGFRPPADFEPRMIDPVQPNFDFAAMGDRERAVATFLACGDLSAFDADMCYGREPGAQSLAPSHPPTQAPYLQAVADRSKRARTPPETEER